jgi:hypothetical protein
MAFDPITAVADFAGKVVDKLFPDKTEAAKAKAALDLVGLQQDFQLLQGQMQINVEEAKSTSVFVAGWRPFVGWVCGCGFAWTFVAGPFLMFALNALGHEVSLPVLDYSELSTLLLGMLGLGGMRSYDKRNGK